MDAVLCDVKVFRRSGNIVVVDVIYSVENWLDGNDNDTFKIKGYCEYIIIHLINIHTLSQVSGCSVSDPPDLVLTAYFYKLL